jgi:isocitrate dehydrogenase
MRENKTIVVAFGDGIGPEIMEATLNILKYAKARVNVESVEIGEQMYLKGYPAGITPEAWEKVLKHRVLLKAPMTTPQGKGFKSLNVTLRKSLGLFANVRPCASLYPAVSGFDTKMDMVIIRENEEDLYAGIEYKPSYDTAISHKMITRPGSEKIIRYAFEYARNNRRKKVTCLVKDNIMKIADGMFHDIFKSMAQEYPDIESDSIIVDIGSARVASRPKDFDVIVTLNLYGDIVSDIAAEMSGSVGLAGSSNIGEDFGMFEAVHGSAPDIAGKGIANPSGLLNGAVLMLEYLGQYDIAELVKNAWLKTLEEGVHTADIFAEGVSKRKVNTHEFAQAVIANLGGKPQILNAYMPGTTSKNPATATKISTGVEKCLIGVDFILGVKGLTLAQISEKLEGISPDLKLHSVAQRGLKIWPESSVKISDLDIINCRFIGFQDTGVTPQMTARLYQHIVQLGLDVTATHSLYTYDEKPGFTTAQGE